ncbi:MAG: S24 family peptidase [Alphaproteobacteria bacterium]|nr:S24 family peptidase [Alphaproteobacteria bacterium]
MKPDDIWRGIDRLAADQGITPARLAKYAGLDQSVFSAGRRRNAKGDLRWPGLESLARVFRVTNISLSDFVGYMHADPASRSAFRIPVLPIDKAARNEHYDEDGFPTGGGWDRMEFPDVQDRRCFALKIDSDDHLPIYRPGDILICAPGMSLRRGDRIVYRRGEMGLSIAALVRQTPFRVDLASLDGTETDTFPAQEISWITRIAWARQ